ncbi:hypothetical protein BZZ01_04475 [Nostocales cyanobacterium HT-58-2]|nr:hypothetical protein BZZ01_04475 [Nostocales cyanobacterium HT-58-2]
MVHPIYTAEYLSSLKRPQLWTICEQLGLPKYPASAKCLQAIIGHQFERVQPIGSAEIQASEEERAKSFDAYVEQEFQKVHSLAQAELNAYIEAQASTVAKPVFTGYVELPVTTEFTTQEISFYHHKVLANNKTIAEITYDHGDFVTQPWVVMVNKEVWRANTYLKCFNYISRNHKMGTLPAMNSDEAINLEQVQQGDLIAIEDKEGEVLQFEDFGGGDLGVLLKDHDGIEYAIIRRKDTKVIKKASTNQFKYGQHIQKYSPQTNQNRTVIFLEYVDNQTARVQYLKSGHRVTVPTSLLS